MLLAGHGRVLASSGKASHEAVRVGSNMLNCSGGLVLSATVGFEIGTFERNPNIEF